MEAKGRGQSEWRRKKASYLAASVRTRTGAVHRCSPACGGAGWLRREASDEPRHGGGEQRLGKVAHQQLQLGHVRSLLQAGVVAAPRRRGGLRRAWAVWRMALGLPSAFPPAQRGGSRPEQRRAQPAYDPSAAARAAWPGAARRAASHARPRSRAAAASAPTSASRARSAIEPATSRGWLHG